MKRDHDYMKPKLKRRKLKSNFQKSSMDLVQITNNEKAEFRTWWHKKQNLICPLLKIEVPLNNVALDHKHKRKKDPVGPNGDGLIRGVVQLQANALEGKIINSFKRLGLDKFIELPALLRNIADYLENPPIPQKYIHPNEIKKEPVLSRQSFNQLVRLYHKKYPKRKELTYTYSRSKKHKPKPSQKLTKTLKQLYSEFNVKPKFYKG